MSSSFNFRDAYEITPSLTSTNCMKSYSKENDYESQNASSIQQQTSEVSKSEKLDLNESLPLKSVSSSLNEELQDANVLDLKLKPSFTSNKCNLKTSLTANLESSKMIKQKQLELQNNCINKTQVIPVGMNDRGICSRNVADIAKRINSLTSTNVATTSKTNLNAASKTSLTKKISSIKKNKSVSDLTKCLNEFGLRLFRKLANVNGKLFIQIFSFVFKA